MDADVAGEDELHSDQADALGRELGSREGQRGVPDVEHDVGGRGGKRIEVDLVDGEGQRSGPDVALVALGAAHRDRESVGELGADRPRPHDGGDPELTGDDRGVRGASAAFGHDRRSGLQYRLPVGVGHVGDDHVALLNPSHVAGVGDAADSAGSDPVADRQPGGKHLRRRLEAIHRRHRRPRTTAVDRLGSGLDDEQLAGDAVLRPLDVHRGRLAPDAGVVILDRNRPLRQLQDVVVAHRVARPVVVRRRRSDEAVPAVVVRHADLLGTERAADQRAEAVAQTLLVHVEPVGDDLALHDRLAEAPRRRHVHDVSQARFGVEREHHAAGREIRPHHSLDPDTQGDIGLVDPHVSAIADRPGRVEAGEALADRAAHVTDAVDHQIGLLLAGERRLGQILGRRARSHGHIDSGHARLGAQLRVGVDDRLGQIVGQRGRRDGGADAASSIGEVVDVDAVPSSEGLGRHVGERVRPQEVSECGRRGGEPVGHPDAPIRQLAIHLAEGSVLAADDGHIVHRRLVEPSDHIHDVSRPRLSTPSSAEAGSTGQGPTSRYGP